MTLGHLLTAHPLVPHEGGKELLAFFPRTDRGAGSLDSSGTTMPLPRRGPHRLAGEQRPTRRPTLPVSRFRSDYYRPDVIQESSYLDVMRQSTRQPEGRNQEAARPCLRPCLPLWRLSLSHRRLSPEGNQQHYVRYRSVSPTAEPVTGLWFSGRGQPRRNRQPTRAMSGKFGSRCLNVTARSYTRDETNAAGSTGWKK